jgi:aspartyl-tRNA(Asn)/glutamyl-tRNA(Gln) amidotransferase subunit A
MFSNRWDDRPMSDPADLGVLEASGLLSARRLSSRELVDACLARIAARDGRRSFDGDPGSVNAWVRVYEEQARESAARADARLAAGGAPALCGVPIALKDLYAVEGLPLTASSRVLDEEPLHSCDAWARLAAEGMVLLGHVHTHEFAAGGTTDQVGNPWDLARSAGGSSGGSAAALASRTTPAATGTDTAGSLRIPSAMCGTATVKPTLGSVPLRGIVPLGPTLDHAGPMARSVADCEPLLAAMADARPPAERRPLRRVALSPRIGGLDADVAKNFERVSALLPVVSVPVPPLQLDLGFDFLDLLCAGMAVYHRGLADRRALYRPSTRGFLEHGDARAMTAAEYVAVQQERAELRAAWLDWFDAHEVDAIIEPTVPIVARERGHGYDRPFTDGAEISLTHYWNWTGLPVVALPSGIGSRSRLPTSVSLIGAPGAEWDLLAAGIALEAELGSVSPANL